MKWRFWTRTQSPCDDCSRIEPLLSLESDGMASSEETRQIASHLQACPSCRQTREWMTATRQVIATRPFAEPPFDMRARIARAIAESSPSPIPVAARPAPRRPLVLRPAFASAMTFAVVLLIGVGAYQLSEMTPPSVTPKKVAVRPMPPMIKSKPSVIKPAPLLARRPAQNSGVKKIAPPVLTARAAEVPEPSPVSVAPAPRREMAVRPSVKPSISARVKLVASGNNKPSLPTPAPRSAPPEKIASNAPPSEPTVPVVNPTPTPDVTTASEPVSQPPVTVARRDLSSEIRSRLTAQQGSRPARTVVASYQQPLRSAAFSPSELDSSTRNPGSGTADIVHTPGF